MTKTTLFSLLITLAVTFGFANQTFAQSSGKSFAASNQQSESLGQMTISSPSGDYYLTVPGMSNDTAQIPDTATSVTINGQMVPSGVKAIVQLQSGKFVMLLWPALNTITVIDTDVLG